jgi:predicted component of type VI protein secretion system
MAASAAPRTHAILKIKAAGRTRLVVFDTADLSLGRAPENDISVDDPEMSRRHAVFKRSREGCAVEDMGTSNGTLVNGQAAARAVLKHGDVVKIGEVEITYAETSRTPSSLGAGVEYASQLKAFGTRWRRCRATARRRCSASPICLRRPTTISRCSPRGQFDFDLASSAKVRAPRDLDAEVADLDASFAFGDEKTQAPERAAKPAARPAPAPAPAAKPARRKPDVWELDMEAPAKPAAGPLAVTLEIEGLSGDLRRAGRGAARQGDRAAEPAREDQGPRSELAVPNGRADLLAERHLERVTVGSRRNAQ